MDLVIYDIVQPTGNWKLWKHLVSPPSFLSVPPLALFLPLCRKVVMSRRGIWVMGREREGKRWANTNSVVLQFLPFIMVFMRKEVRKRLDIMAKMSLLDNLWLRIIGYLGGITLPTLQGYCKDEIISQFLLYSINCKLLDIFLEFLFVFLK